MKESTVYNITAEALQELEEVFRQYDCNGDGYISVEKFEEILSFLDDQPPSRGGWSKKIQDYIRELCAEPHGRKVGDGLPSHLTLDDFYHFFADVLLQDEDEDKKTESVSSNDSSDTTDSNMDAFHVLCESTRAPCSKTKGEPPFVDADYLTSILEEFGLDISKEEAEAMAKYHNPRPEHKRITRSQYRSIIKQRDHEQHSVDFLRSSRK